MNDAGESKGEGEKAGQADRPLEHVILGQEAYLGEAFNIKCLQLTECVRSAPGKQSNNFGQYVSAAVVDVIARRIVISSRTICSKRERGGR